MKRIIAIIALLIIAVSLLASCNKQVFDFNYNFDRAYVQIGDEWKDLAVDKWTDYEDGEQLQLTLEDGTVMIVHSKNCILYNGDLPN